MPNSSAPDGYSLTKRSRFFHSKLCCRYSSHFVRAQDTERRCEGFFYGVAMSAIRGLFSHRNDLRSQIPDTGAESASHNGGERERKAQQHFVL